MYSHHAPPRGGRFAAVSTFTALFAYLSLTISSCAHDPAVVMPGTGRPLPDTLTVAFYNVENLFDFNLDGTEYNEYKPGWYGWTEDIQRKKLANAARVIAAMGADIVGLCEIENQNTVDELQAELDGMDATYPYTAVGSAPGSATVTALLSKFPIAEKREHQVGGRYRSILEARIASGGDELIVFVNHWPSKRSKESKRLEAAQILRQRIDELPAGTDYVITGDLNASLNEFATFHTAGFNDTEGRTGVNHVLKTVVAADDGAATRFVCKGELATCADCHYSLWLELPEDRRMSYVYRGTAETIDHIIVPPALFDDRGYSYLDGSFEVFTMNGELLRDGAPYRWQMFFKGKEKYHAGRGYSDHLPVKARFVRAAVLANGDDESGLPPPSNCEIADPQFVAGDFETAVDGWISGDARFSVVRDTQYSHSGRHSLRISGIHDSENRTAAKAVLQTHGIPHENLTMSVRGAGNLSLRVRRPGGKWVYHNAPDFKPSKSAKYKPWQSGGWTNLKIPVPPRSGDNDDVEVELRSGKGAPLSVWIDKVRLK